MYKTNGLVLYSNQAGVSNLHAFGRMVCTHLFLFFFHRPDYCNNMLVEHQAGPQPMSRKAYQGNNPRPKGPQGPMRPRIDNDCGKVQVTEEAGGVRKAASLTSSAQDGRL